MSPRPGDLRERVVLQRRSDATNTFGDTVPLYSELDTVWGSVAWRSGSEAFDGERYSQAVPADIVVRYGTATAPLREKDRVLVPAVATTLTAALGTTATSMSVADGAPFPQEGEFLAKVNSEFVVVTDNADTSWTVRRNAFATGFNSHSTGAAVIEYRPLDIEGVWREPRENTLHINAVERWGQAQLGSTGTLFPFVTTGGVLQVHNIDQSQRVIVSGGALTVDDAADGDTLATSDGGLVVVD